MNVYSFRRLRWGPPRPLSTPHFLFEPLHRRLLRGTGAWLRFYGGFVLLGVMLGVAAISLSS